MASYYVWSGATGSANGTSWANAYTTLTTAFSGKAGGDVFYVAHDHSELGGAVALTPPGSVITPAKIVCVNRAGSVPPVSADRRATAQVASGTNNNLDISGNAHFDGIIFLCGAGTSSSAYLTLLTASNSWLRLDNCSLRLGINNSGGSAINIGGSGYNLGCASVELNNTTVSFAHVVQTFWIAGAFKWRNTPSAIIGAVPTTLLNSALAAARGTTIECIGIDLSALGSGKVIMGIAGSSQNATARFIDCKLNAAVTKVSGAGAAAGGTDADFVRSSATGNYAVSRHRFTGTLTEETTIVRTGGATDGTQTISWKVVTSSNAFYSNPFECPPVAIWNDTTGSAKTATIECIWGGGAVPLDSEIWVDVEYLGDASSPQGYFANDGTADLLTTAANQTSSSATWGGSTTKFKLNVTFTPQLKGWIYARVKCAKASSTFYIDPLITLT